MSRENQRRDGRRPEDENQNESQNESVNESQLDALNEELLHDHEAASIIEAVVAGLDTASIDSASPTENGWESLRAKLAVDFEKPTAGGSDERSDAMQLTAGHGTGERLGRSGQTQVHETGAPTPASSSNASRWLVAMALVAAVVVAGSWGALKAGEAAKLRDDQRILAYWMSNPDMRMVALAEPGSGLEGPGDPVGDQAEKQAATGNARLGIICFLPDGRALLLQPNRAPRGASFVVMGGDAGGTKELARGRSNMLLFDAGGVQSVEVVLARSSDDTEVVARATFN